MFAIRRPVFTQSHHFFSTLAQIFEKAALVPDVTDKAPHQVANIIYPSGVKVILGNELTPKEVKDPPSVKWTTEANSLYLLCMTDPDAPSRKKPDSREWLHWLVGNIPGDVIKKGEILSQYIGSGPPQGTSFHRYVFLIYKQTRKLTFNELRLTNKSTVNRQNFSIREFAEKYKLGQPVAGNFYLARWDAYVPVLYKQLGVDL